MTHPSGSRGDQQPLTVALLGNPNTGKSTLFSALAGIPTRIGNYPGVTVEEKVGRFTHGDRIIDLVDLPGTYSLRPQSPDEQVAVDVLQGRMEGVPPPDCVVVVADATNLERNLFLATQALELGLPTVIALTLADIATTKGIEIDAAELSRRLGCPVLRVVAPTREGIRALGDQILATAGSPPPRPIPLDFQPAAVAAQRSPAAARMKDREKLWRVRRAVPSSARSSASSRGRARCCARTSAGVGRPLLTPAPAACTRSWST